MTSSGGQFSGYLNEINRLKQEICLFPTLIWKKDDFGFTKERNDAKK